MDATERRYRAALRCYPLAWRSQHEDYVLGTLLDVDENDPDRRARHVTLEVLTLALHGAAERTAFLTNVTSRSIAAALTLAAGLAYALFQFATFDHYAIGTPSAESAAVSTPLLAVPDVSLLLPVLWVVAAVAALARWERLRVTALLAVPIVVLLILVPRVVNNSAGGVSRYALLFEASTALVAACGRPIRRLMLIALAVWASAFAAVAWSNDSLRGTASIWIWALGPFNAAGITLGLIAVALMIGASINIRQIRTAGALLLAALPWIAMLLAELGTNRFNYFTSMFAIESTGFLSLCGIVLALLYRRQRRTDPVPRDVSANAAKTDARSIGRRDLEQ